MSDVDISDKKVKSTIGFLNIEADACRGDGRQIAANTFTSIANMLSVLRASLTATQEKLAAAEAAISTASRTNPGVIEQDSSIADAVLSLAGANILNHNALTTAQAKFVALAFAIENGRRGTFSDDKTEELVGKVLAAQAQIAAARNEGLEMAASYAETYDGSELADGIRALKSKPPAPVRDDEDFERDCALASDAVTDYISWRKTASESLVWMPAKFVRQWLEGQQQ